MKITSKLTKTFQNNRNKVYVLVLIVLAIITHLSWFNPFSVITYGDWQYRPDDHVIELFSTWNTWLPFTGIGGLNILMSGYFLRGVLWPLIASLFTYDIATKLTLFIPVALGGFLSPYFLSKKLTRDKDTAFACAVFYGSTTYFLITQTAHLPIAFIYALLPALILYFDKTLKNNKFYNWAILSLLFSVGIAYEVRMMYIVAFVLSIYYLFYVFENNVRAFYYWDKILLFIFLIFLENLFWILPTFSAMNEISSVANRGLFGNDLFDINHAFTVNKWNWTGGEVDRTFTLQANPFYLWVPPLLAFAALIFKGKNNKKYLFYLILAITGIALTKQSSEPFAELYEWLYDNFPGFALFREASKFYVLTAFGYLGLISISLTNLRNSFRKLYIVAILLIVIVSGINLFPAADTSIGGTFNNSRMPNDYELFEELVKSDSSYYRTLWLPREAWWGYFDNNHPRISGVDILLSDWKNYGMESLSPDRQERSEQLLSFFKNNDADDILDNASVKYIVIPVPDNDNDANVFNAYGGQRNRYISTLDNVSYLEKVEYGFDELVVYENTDYRGSVSIVDLVQIDNLKHVDTYSKIVESSLLTPDSSSDKLIAPFQEANKFNLMNESDSRYKIYMNSNVNKIKLSWETNKVILYEEKLTNIYLNSNPITKDVVKELYSFTPGDHTYYLNVDGHISEIEHGSDITLGEKNNINTISIGRLNEGDSYTNFEQLEIVSKTIIDKENGFNKILINLPDGKTSYLKTADNIVGENNLISNGSFELGKWQKKVGDCNNKDADKSIAQSIDTNLSTDGSSSLELIAQKHIACIYQDIDIEGGLTYRLSFDYLSTTNSKVGYYLKFNDNNSSPHRDVILDTSQDWKKYQKSFKAPLTSDKARLYLYSYETNGVDMNRAFYDDVKFVEEIVPSDYIILEKTKINSGTKGLIAAQRQTPTTIDAHLSTKRRSEDIHFAEKFNDNWVISIGRISDLPKCISFFAECDNSYEPDFAYDNGNSLTLDNEAMTHKSSTISTNVWSLDINHIIENYPQEYYRKNQDGSISIYLNITYQPQSLFNKGLYISSASTIAIAAYSFYGSRKYKNDKTQIEK